MAIVGKSTVPVSDYSTYRNRLFEMVSVEHRPLDVVRWERIQVDVSAVDMLRVLPADIRGEVEADLAEGNRSAVLDDVRGILLDALAQKGGEV